MCELLCTLKSLKSQIRSWKSTGILFLHGSMNPEGHNKFKYTLEGDNNALFLFGYACM